MRKKKKSRFWKNNDFSLESDILAGNTCCCEQLIGNMGLEIVTHVEVITEIMKASEAGKRQNTKMAEKPGAHGKDLQFLHF